MKVGFVSLGCTKNLVDTETCMGYFTKEKIEIVNNPQIADVIIINTCGFIEPAKQEAINTILEMAEYKVSGACKYLIVMGCLVQRYKEDLEKDIPEVDLFIKIDEYDMLWDKIANLIGIKNNDKSAKIGNVERVISTGNNTAYLKIAEGCSNRCTYCAIPNIRGPYISRPIEEVIAEAEKLDKKGYKELIIIAQDTTKYGIDLYGKSRLAELLDRVAKMNFKWIRFLYAYPESITDELISVVKNNDNICNYFDIPIQHSSEHILKLMNRKSNGKSIRNLIKKIRKEIPDVIIRTTLMVGFPRETEEDFLDLYEFVNEVKFDKLGCFKYSKEDGTAASRIVEQIHPKTKQARYNKIMGLEKAIAKIKLEEKIGNVYEAIVDGFSNDNKYICARSYMDIPDEDGTIFIKNNNNINAGDIIKVKITGVRDYDLIAELI